MILYGRGQSRSFRALWALNEAGVEFEYEEVELGPAVTDEYRSINSQGKVPTLVSGDLVLTESAAIVNYAAMLAPGKALIPVQVDVRALYDEVCYFVMTDFEQPLWTIGKHRFALPEAYRRDVFETAEFEFRKSQDALLSQFDGIGYRVGETFTMADVLLAHTVNWAERFEMPVDQSLLTYRDRLYARPACVKALEEVQA